MDAKVRLVGDDRPGVIPRTVIASFGDSSGATPHVPAMPAGTGLGLAADVVSTHGRRTVVGESALGGAEFNFDLVSAK